ncbi:hypothetical protein EJ05DRAFT_447376 [Pseudovirgaria hyperparasitica]|uniref:Uncharacterized protein n=1 Tax=Pseudovirgaria hyperparasitica TaxID=470096 RepID=A0A6A6WL83_9PEZI|nr:uncharacterized protein EJ05DRAFT_447376 [Pseudovirgaria hyperparasitica]KAF2762933.1 hypothetical protein EJ05DRAFT_447376 [Pseudovirgaria hyperparasitica]
MGSNDIPPPHVPKHVVPTCNALLQLGGSLWTLTYILYTRQSFRDKSYGMPLFALALNFAWELVYALVVAESLLEKTVFTVWLVIDCFMVYGTVKYARYEWSHAPQIARNMGKIFIVLAGLAIWGQWAFAKWWIDNDVGRREGKFYRGVVGPDTTELGFWSALFNQVYLSAASLAALGVRGHSGGVSWGIWATRAFGSVFGLYAVYAWEWYFWREAHGYVMNPFAVFMWGVSIICDVVYPFALWRIKKTERVLADGRKVPFTSPVLSSAKVD